MSVRVQPMAPELNPAAGWPKVKKMQLKSAKPVSTGPSRQRPDTATLEKPLVLDPGLIRKLDMTRISRERLMTIEYLMATPKKIKGNARAKEKTTILSPRIKRKEVKSADDSWDDSSAADEPKLRKLSRVMNTTYRVRSHARKSLKEVLTPSPALLQVPCVEAERAKGRSPVRERTDGLAGALEAVPAPCHACGRKEQPERLHAHPKRAVKKKPKDDQENKEAQPKSTVTKPLPMKFRSGKSREKSAEPASPENVPKKVSLIRRDTFKVERSSRVLPVVDKKESPVSPFRRSVNKTRRSPVPSRSPDKEGSNCVSSSEDLGIPLLKNPVVHSASSLRRPKTILCYLCSQQFFVKSFPLHEPHCLQKWQRENDELPAHLQMPTPQKPDVELTSEEWNQYAWKAVQALLVPCGNCNRTFLPVRLEAHMRACRLAHPVKKSCTKRQRTVRRTSVD